MGWNFLGKLKINLPYDQAKNHSLEEISALPSHRSTTHNGQDMETTYLSID